MAISNGDILTRITAIEKRIGQLQDIIESIPKLRQLGAIKAALEADLKDLNAKVGDLTARVDNLENK
jgi:hypothetical protein